MYPALRLSTRAFFRLLISCMLAGESVRNKKKLPLLTAPFLSKPAFSDDYQGLLSDTSPSPHPPPFKQHFCIFHVLGPTQQVISTQGSPTFWFPSARPFVLREEEIAFFFLDVLRFFSVSRVILAPVRPFPRP